MKDTHKMIYEAPTLKALRLGVALMLNDTSTIASGGKASKQVEVDSKAFWGGSIFDDETEDEDYVDDIVP